MDGSFLLVAVILIALVGYMAYAKSQRDQRTFSSLYKPADERLLADETVMDGNGSIAFTGDTDFVTRPFPMQAGDYKLIYRFPEAAPVKVELFSEDGTDSEVIVIKSGAGEVGFSVESNGRYFCKIDPTKDGDWEIEMWRIKTLTSRT